ncbi:molybdopterin molybdotransferase MoeA [Staphylococcus gallinarum]|jgi:molybdopterin molybdotransferase|uniref:molybdopterin molybdotransferase MoeA n=1 Tax=Staphylococcus gallinarum TaxID=1293 RepID=UPI000D1F52EB|nr:gephyrin-like molybdotransferase Glp [Staphylococcus gallinarum]MCD8821548.1 molybdopterin molybdotransferase MoeA [Staphylococcus gallinarum]MCQ9289383.1 molybdopterin molybdotransferase MoeA [Staphylococcus gallinarum]MCW0985459.1 molybdopterin molybdotransferase MoeA [Staphylococcus gallinarum]MEB6243275.1 molybdopterin molybdotransferase MoeA [Staphylococcus gallinarum]MEB6296348.1 molybdopterin molybdotransferase MoeA [Staphylococcus gallinarum]
MPVEKRTPIPVSEAIKRIVNENIIMDITNVKLSESLNYILAEDIVATYDIPRFDKSPYDGFALRSIDTTEASGDNRIFFKVIDHIGAGAVSNESVGEHEAVRIMTGAAIPKGADAVVMLEQTTEYESGFTIRKQFDALENIAIKGEETKTGDIVLQKGQRINAGAIAVLATYGYTEVPVYNKPSVAIIATGSELLDVGDELEPGKIRNSNGPMISALAQNLGLTIETYKIQQDDLDTSIETVTNALQQHDIIITTGGVSVGDFDYLPQIYQHLEAKVLFNKVAMRPGSVTTVAVAQGKYLFGLSGNPSACYTGFELFVRTAVLKMTGAQAVYPQVVRATLMEDFTKPNPFTRFIRATTTFDGHQMTVTPSGFNKSGAVVAIAHSNAMIMLPGGTRGYKKGYTVDVILTESDSREYDLTL